MKVAVSGAFHSPYMAEATEGLATYIQAGHAPSPLLIPVMANMTAAPIRRTRERHRMSWPIR